MGKSSENVVLQVVERFLKLRREGRRLSIDQVLDSFGELPRRQATRDEALNSLAGFAREALDAGQLPELEGYDIIELLGRGGMGAVFEAYQRSTGRRVAVKFMLDAAIASATARRRFEREVELVSRFSHPGIVSIIDSGVQRGRYYFVMDFVDGRPLDEALPAGTGDVRQALELLARVCHAVDYAHQRGVLHRDLKPSNVLIDERGQPRLLDFGLAKAIDDDTLTGGRASISEAGQMIGTLPYMSPEQSRGDFASLSLRTDVYSLGAMAYEIITGQLPCPMTGPIADVLRRIAEHDPPRPSTLRRGLSADVDAILLKALEKEPDRRYSTCSELAADIQRHLDHRPILARPTGLITRTARWIRRNRAVAGVIATASIVLLCVGAFSISRILEAQRQTALENARKEQVASFWEDMNRVFDLGKKRGADIRLTEAYDEALQQAQERFASDPEAKSRVLSELGANCRQLGMFDHAETFFKSSLEASTALYGENDANVAANLIELGYTLKQIGRRDEAEPLYRKAIQIHKYLRQDEAVANDLTYLGKLLADESRTDEARQCYDEALTARSRLPLDEDNQLEISKLNFHKGIMMLYAGAYADAEVALRRTLDHYKSIGYETESPLDIAALQTCIALALCRQGNTQEAETLCREGMKIREKSFPPADYPDGHQDLVDSYHVLGEILLAIGRPQEAQQVLAKALQFCDNKFKNLLDAPVIRSLYGESLAAQGQSKEAEPYLLSGYRALRKQAADRQAVQGAAAFKRLRTLFEATGRGAELQALLADQPQPASQP